MHRWTAVAGVAGGWAGAIFWAVGITVLQPLTEPLGPWPERLASNNTYWARDLRFMAIAAALAGVILASRGDRRVAGFGVLAALGWVGADLWLDRADVTGTAPTVLLAAAGCAVVAGTTALVRRKPAPSNRGTLILAASVCAALVPLAAGIESPTDREPELTPAALAVGAILLVVAAGRALAAATVPGPATPRPALTRARLLVAAGYLLLGGVGLVVLRSVPPGGRFVAMVLLGGLLLAGVAALGWPWAAGGPGWVKLGSAAFGALLGYPAVLLGTLLVTGFALPAARPLTHLAGNISVNAADEDILLSLVGLVTGLVLGGVLSWGARDDRMRPAGARSTAE